LPSLEDLALSYEKAIILHKVLTELHIGMLFLATIAAVAAVFSWGRARRQGIARISDGTFIGATVCGTLFLVLSALTGFVAWPWERLWRTPMIYSKVTYFALGLNFWLILLWSRLMRGAQVWERLSRPMLGCAVLGFTAIMMAASAGGHLGHGVSLLDPLFRGLDPYKPVVLAPWWSAGVISVGIYLTVRPLFEKQEKMKKMSYAVMIALFVISAGLTKLLWRDEKIAAAHPSHKSHMEHGTEKPGAGSTQESGMPGHKHGKDDESASQKKGLKPAEGARVEILSPKEGQVFKSDEIPVHFEFVKGKRGHHIHAYVDGELMGMFESEKGTLTGIQPGKHVLEARVATQEHGVELNATDKLRFVVETKKAQR
jgi:hypothetical protein